MVWRLKWSEDPMCFRWGIRWVRCQLASNYWSCNCEATMSCVGRFCLAFIWIPNTALAIRENEACPKWEDCKGLFGYGKFHGKWNHSISAVDRSGAFPHSTSTDPINDRKVTKLENMATYPNSRAYLFFLIPNILY